MTSKRAMQNTIDDQLLALGKKHKETNEYSKALDAQQARIDKLDAENAKQGALLKKLANELVDSEAKSAELLKQKRLALQALQGVDRANAMRSSVASGVGVGVGGGGSGVSDVRITSYGGNLPDLRVLAASEYRRCGVLGPYHSRGVLGNYRLTCVGDPEHVIESYLCDYHATTKTVSLTCQPHNADYQTAPVYVIERIPNG